MERYIAIKESFFEKWNGEPMRLYVMSQLIRFVSYKDTEYVKKGCLIYNEVQLAKKLNIGRMSLRRVVEYLNKKGEIEIRGCGKGRILEVLYYNTYVISSEEKEKKEVYQKETVSVPKRDSKCTKMIQLYIIIIIQIITTITITKILLLLML